MLLYLYLSKSKKHKNISKLLSDVRYILLIVQNENFEL